MKSPASGAPKHPPTIPRCSHFWGAAQPYTEWHTLAAWVLPPQAALEALLWASVSPTSGCNDPAPSSTSASCSGQQRRGPEKE